MPAPKRRMSVLRLMSTSIFKQTRSAGGWQDAAVDADTARQIENSILTRARQLYIATVDSQ